MEAQRIIINKGGLKRLKVPNKCLINMIIRSIVCREPIPALEKQHSNMDAHNMLIRICK